jgi:NAD(P)H-dependent FMN reductase
LDAYEVTAIAWHDDLVGWFARMGVSGVPKPLLQVVIGSTRPGRVGPAVAEWFARRAREHDGFDVEVVDLAEVNLPLLDEPNHPRLRQYVHEHTKAWSRTVERGDAFVFVHPEYNYGVNAALKNAIDYLHFEWQYKPVGFVSYGGVSGGLRAAQMLKQSATALKMVPVNDTVMAPFVSNSIDSDGVFQASELHDKSAHLLLDELGALAGALKSLRADTASNV